jgi:ATP-dependent Clp protease ATP-binding subunit ClpA
MNRIDKVVVFRPLQEQHLKRILDLELQAVQNRILYADESSFIFQCSDAVKEILLEEGTDTRYGARPLKRAVERILVYPLSNLLATRQVQLGDVVHVDVIPETGKLIFSRYRSADALREVQRPEIASARPSIPRLSIAGIYSAA